MLVLDLLACAIHRRWPIHQVRRLLGVPAAVMALRAAPAGAGSKVGVLCPFHALRHLEWQRGQEAPDSCGPEQRVGRTQEAQRVLQAVRRGKRLQGVEASDPAKNMKQPQLSAGGGIAPTSTPPLMVQRAGWSPMDAMMRQLSVPFQPRDRFVRAPSQTPTSKTLHRAHKTSSTEAAG